MSIKNPNARKAGVMLLPFVTAAPMIAAIIYLLFRFGPTVRKLLNILIKMAVAS